MLSKLAIMTLALFAFAGCDDDDDSQGPKSQNNSLNNNGTSLGADTRDGGVEQEKPSDEGVVNAREDGLQLRQISYIRVDGKAADELTLPANEATELTAVTLNMAGGSDCYAFVKFELTNNENHYELRALERDQRDDGMVCTGLISEEPYTFEWPAVVAGSYELKLIAPDADSSVVVPVTVE